MGSNLHWPDCQRSRNSDLTHAARWGPPGVPGRRPAIDVRCAPRECGHGSARLRLTSRRFRTGELLQILTLSDGSARIVVQNVLRVRIARTKAIADYHRHVLGERKQ